MTPSTRPSKPKAAALADIQSTPDRRNIAIDRVGVSDLRYPIVVRDRARQTQQTVATLSLSVALPSHFKGTHMSRFVEVLNAHQRPFHIQALYEMLHELKKKLHAETARIELSFPYFLARKAPVTGAEGLMDYECGFEAESNGTWDDVVVRVKVPVKTLCPCSKAISEYGAHNQRGIVDIAIRPAARPDGTRELVWIEDLVEVAERSGSAPVYSLLKRPDERYVTMQAFENPAFVEDVVRNVAAQLRDDPRVAWFRVHVVNQESIHNHSAFARIEWTRPDVG